MEKNSFSISRIFNPLKWNFKTFGHDLLSGIVVALVSIPISMGYAQVAGLPAVYGLYGSILPILVYALFCSSPQFIVGVDAMPAAMVGSSLATFEIASESSEALTIVPAIALLVALWLFVFRIFKAGRVVKFISNPVMGGFISGVGLTIILMQVPKLFGGNAGTGEIIQLIPHIASQFQYFNWVSCLLGCGTVVVILLSKKIAPRFPMSVVMLLVGIVLAAVFHVEKYGVKLLPAVESGLPDLSMPQLSALQEHWVDWMVLSLAIAAVIMAQTLLAANSYASKYDYPLDNNRELLAYALMNVASAVSGSCPINGSVSRSGMSDQFQSKTQHTSIVAFLTMVLVVLFATQYFIYLPVPILTGIVLSALIGIIDFKQAIRLAKCNKSEFFIFLTAFICVLIFGTIYGVIIGVILSFFQVVRKAVVPPRAFRGKIPGHHGYYNLDRNTNSHPVKNTIIYRFGGNLFFANASTFQNDILGAIKEDTKYVIVDASGIGNIDITAADKLLYLADKLKKQGIQFYITEHPEVVNDQLRAYGAERLIQSGNVRRTVSLALRACGFVKPYPLEGVEAGEKIEYVEAVEKLAEFEWAFGKDAATKMQLLAGEMADNLAATELDKDVNIEKLEEKLSWGKIGLFDEQEFLDRLEIHLEQLSNHGRLSKEHLHQLEMKIENRKHEVEDKVHHLNPNARELLHKHMAKVEERLMQTNPEELEHIKELNELFLRR